MDEDGTVDTVILYYAVGVNNTSYTGVGMTGTAPNFTGAIPNTAFADGDLVKYYVCATDNDNLTTCSADVNDPDDNPAFFRVRDNGTTIFDVQFTPFSNGDSPYEGQDVTVTGVVTASAQADDLGFVYIQQPGQSQWAGLSLTQNGSLANLQRGDSIEVTGTVRENFGLTLMEVTNLTTLATGAAIPDAVELDPGDFSIYDFDLTEPYECMLVKVANPTAGAPLYVVDDNADGPPSNFAEWRVGTDEFDANNGTRILSGRVTSSAFSSLYFPFVNDSFYIDNSGVMPLAELDSICIVQVGDQVTSITGIMYYSFSNMKLLPRNRDDAENYSCSLTIFDPTLDIEDELAGSQIVAYPNPTSGQLNLRFVFPKLVDGQAKLFDLSGHLVGVQAFRAQEGEVGFDLSSLSNGMYVLSIETEGQTVARKKIMLTK